MGVEKFTAQCTLWKFITETNMVTVWERKVSPLGKTSRERRTMRNSTKRAPGDATEVGKSDESSLGGRDAGGAGNHCLTCKRKSK